MNHQGTRLLESKRLILRRFELQDAQAMFVNWASDPQVTKFLRWQAHACVDVSRAILSDWVGRYHQPDFYLWAIVPRDLGEPIGSISVVGHDDHIQMAHIGYAIGRSWWHQGLTSEALSTVLSYLFREVHVNRVESRHDPQNPHSGGVMRKCGLQYEGTHRQADWNQQGICDAACYAILAEDYKRPLSRT